MISANPITFLSIAVLSALSSYAVFLLGTKLFQKWGLLDNPGPYGHDRDPVPFGFGSLLYLNFVLVSLFLAAVGAIEFGDKLVVLIVLGGVVTGLSFVDDLDTIFKFERSEKSKPKTTTEELSQTRKTGYAISPKVRLAMQILVWLIVSLTSIKISYISNLFGGILYLDFFSISVLGYEVYLIPILFTIIWYVLVFNSVNWSDGVPGLTVGLTTITFIVIFILTIRLYLVDTTPALRQNSIFVFGILSILIPSLLWAWHYNLTPKMLLGDSGTMFLAFMIASLAILVGGKVATVATALGIYLVDAIYVIFARILNKKNPLKGDRIHHLHYRLKAIGMSESFIRNFVYSVALFFGVAAVFLDKVGKVFLFVALVVVIVFITKILSLKGNNRRGFSLVELLVVMTIMALVSVTGLKMFGSLETSSANALVQSRIQGLIRSLDRQVSDGSISDYSIAFSNGANGLIVNTNSYGVANPVRLDYEWRTGSGTLSYSGSVKPGYALLSENRTYYREVMTSPAAAMPITLSGTFDLPQKIVTIDDADQKNVFLVMPLDSSVTGNKYPTTIALPSSMTGMFLRNTRSQKVLLSATGATLGDTTLDLTRGDAQFQFTVST